MKLTEYALKEEMAQVEGSTDNDETMGSIS